MLGAMGSGFWVGSSLGLHFLCGELRRTDQPTGEGSLPGEAFLSVR